MSELENRFCWTFGDNRMSGHNRIRLVYFRTNKEASEIRNAYLETVKSIGIGFHDSADIDITHRSILCTEDEDHIPQKVVVLLTGYGLDLSRFEWYEEYVDYPDFGLCCDYNELLKILMWFVKRALPGFFWELDDASTASINDSEELVNNFGYGCV